MIFNEAFWVGFSFVVFIALIAKPVGRFMAQALDNRAKIIQSELDEVLRLKEEAQELLASYQRKQKEIKQESENIIKSAKEEAALIAKESEKELDKALNSRIEMAMQKMSNYEASVINQIRRNSIDIAVGSVRAMILEHLNKEKAEELINQATLEINKKLH